MSDLAWETDVKLACAGEKMAFERLVRRMGGELYRMARTLLRDDEDCADAIQETILSAYKGIVKLREPAYFKTWLFRILIRECRRIRKKNAYRFERPAAEGTVDMGAPDWDLLAALEQLDEPLRTAVKLHYLADLPLSRVSELMEVSEGTLKSRLHRARKQLAKWLDTTHGRRMGNEL